MKLVPVAKQDKRNQTTSKTFDEVMSANCDLSVVFPISGQFGANPEA